METTTASATAPACRISERWPSCNAPIVGTNPTRLRDCFCTRENARISETDLQISITGAYGRQPFRARLPFRAASDNSLRRQDSGGARHLRGTAADLHA